MTVKVSDSKIEKISDIEDHGLLNIKEKSVNVTLVILEWK